MFLLGIFCCFLFSIMLRVFLFWDYLVSLVLFALPFSLSSTIRSSCSPFSRELPGCTLLSSVGSDAAAFSLELQGCPLLSGNPFVFLFLFLLFLFLVVLSSVSFWLFKILSCAIGSPFVALLSSLLVLLCFCSVFHCPNLSHLRRLNTPSN